MEKKIENGLKKPNFWQKFFQFFPIFPIFPIFGTKICKRVFPGVPGSNGIFAGKFANFPPNFWEEIAKFLKNCKFPQNAIPKGIKLKNFCTQKSI